LIDRIKAKRPFQRLQQELKSGALIKIFENQWNRISLGKPIVTTPRLLNDIGLARLSDIWTQYVNWRENLPSLPRGDIVFEVNLDNNKIAVIENFAAVNIMHKEELKM
jgi:hypothetical protein